MSHLLYHSEGIVLDVKRTRDAMRVASPGDLHVAMCSCLYVRVGRAHAHSTGDTRSGACLRRSKPADVTATAHSTASVTWPAARRSPADGAEKDAVLSDQSLSVVRGLPWPCHRRCCSCRCLAASRTGASLKFGHAQSVTHDSSFLFERCITLSCSFYACIWTQIKHKI